jgi:UPF0716 protein FxsA
MVVVLLVIAFIIVPIAELAAIIWVGTQIGVLPTIAILIIDSIVGSLLMRHQGRAAWRRFNLALQERRPPAKEVVDGALVIFGGALLLTPGFITDFLGLFLLVPPTRAVVRRTLMGWFGKRFIVTRVAGAAAGAAGAGARRVRNRPPRPGTTQPYDVEGSAVDVDSGDPPPLTS